MLKFNGFFNPLNLLKMKKLLILLAFVIVASFTSCTDLDDNDTFIQETQSIEKDEVTPPGGGGNEGDPDDTEN